MSDIIANAKQLLDGATPAPWEHYNDHGIVSLASGDTPIATDLNPWDADLIAAAPELAQALAEETWEYAVQVKIGAKWLFLGKGFGGHNFAKNACWFEKKEKAQKYQLIRRGTAPTRIVCRRVSPVEVINV